MRRIASHNANRGAGRWGFTLVELMVVIVIVVIASIIGVSAWMRMAAESEQRSARSRLETLATVIKAYEAERRDFPPMRYADLGVTLNFSLSTGRSNPRWDESVEALVYMIQYRSGAGPTLNRLPGRVLAPHKNETVAEVGPSETRALYQALDPWGNPIQYLRPRGGYPAANPLSRERLNNQVILVSMGPDAMPGVAGVNDDNPGVAAETDIWEDPAGSGVWYPDPKELGMGDDIKMVVGSIR